MKKLIILTITTLIGLNVFAKDLDQLISEFPFNDTYSAKNTYILANKADFDKEFNKFKSSETAMSLFNTATPVEQRNSTLKAYVMFSPYYNMFHEEITNVSDIVVLQLSANVFCKIPNAYDKLKKNNWKLNNCQPPLGKIVVCALIMQDYDTVIAKMPGMGNSVNYIWDMIKRDVLTKMPVDKGIKILDLVENEMLLSGGKENLEELQVIKKALTMRKLTN